MPAPASPEYVRIYRHRAEQISVEVLWRDREEVCFRVRGTNRPHTVRASWFFARYEFVEGHWVGAVAAPAGALAAALDDTDFRSAKVAVAGKARLSWSEMERRYVGGKYRGRRQIPGHQAHTVRVVDVNLGGDVAVRYRGSSSDPVIPQAEFLEWLQSAKVLEQPRFAGLQHVPEEHRQTA